MNLEYPSDVTMNPETLFREQLGNIYSESNLDGITYFLLYFQTLSTSKLVFKQGLSDCTRRVFTITILLLLRNTHQQASFQAFQGLMVPETGFHRHLLFGTGVGKWGNLAW